MGRRARLVCWGRVKRLWILTFMALAIGGCHAAREGALIGNESLSEVKIVADAYSFNARIWRDDKPTSFKLELYRTDSLLGIAARGYLGKGAFKGWLRSDSIRVYFPQSRELLYESLDDLVKSSDCGVSVAGLRFLDLFGKTPDSLVMPEKVEVHSDYATADHPIFKVASEGSGCPWQLEIGYDRQGEGWTPLSLKFDNGRGLVLKADRERFRARIGIPLKRFTVAVPPDAIRTIP